MRHRITAFGVACAFLVCCVVIVWVMATFSGCATMNKLLGVKDYYTIDMYLNDGTLIPTNLPNKTKQFIDNDNAFWIILYSDNETYAIRYWLKGGDSCCDHWTECYSGKDIMIVIWDIHGIFVKGWIYNEKGIPVRAYEETVMDLLYEITGQEEVKGDSV